MSDNRLSQRSLPAPMVQSPAPMASPASAALTPSAIIGVAVSGSVVLIIALSVMFILCHRARHRKATPCFECQKSIPQTDHSTIERPQKVLRRNRHGAERPLNGWASIGSTADLHQRPMMIDLSLSHSARQAEHVQRSSRVSWPLRRYPSLRGTRSLAQLQDSPLSAIAESPQLLSKISPNVSGRAELPADLPSTSRQTAVPLMNSPSTKQPDDPYVDVPTPKNLMPEPLFAHPIAQDRLSSHIQRSKSDRYRPISGLNPTMELTSVSRKGRARAYSRAASLSNETCGAAPQMPVPSLPPGIISFDQCGRRVVSAQRRPSVVSASSGGSASSSVLGPKGTVSTPQKAVKSATSKPASLAISEGQPRGLGILDAGLEDFPKTAFSNVPLRHPTVRRLQSSQISHDSISSMSSLGYRAIQNRKSWNTGRISLEPSSVEEGEQLSKRLSQCSVLSNGGSVSSASKVPVLSVRPSCARTISFIEHTPDHENAKSRGNETDRRRPESILRDVSGNDLGPPQSRSLSEHSSTVTKNPFGFSSIQSQRVIKPSAMKNSPNAKKKGHKRQNCVRISTQATVFGAYSSPPIIEESDAPSTPTRIPIRRENTLLLKTQDLRPPTRPLFNPQLTTSTLADYTTRRTMSRDESQLSPTLSMIRYYGCSHSVSPAKEDFTTFSNRLSKHHSGSSVLSTITRPSSIQITPKEMKFSFVAKDAIPSQALKSLKESTPPLAPISPATLEAPPKIDIMATAPAWGRTGSTIRGPRSQPPRALRSIRSPPAWDIQRSVAALRRMDSEISDLSLRRKDRYLNVNPPSEAIGSPGPSILGSDIDSVDGGSPMPPTKMPRMEPRIERGMRDLRAMYLSPSRKTKGGGKFESQENLYDPDGFLRS